MSDGARIPQHEPTLVPGELRGYRQFHVRANGLYPLVHCEAGPWDGRSEHACCAAGQEHAAPAVDCGCGLYAWYLPGSAVVSVGAASAVVAARGRCVLGDRGFRAAQARIEAVTLPAVVRWNPAAARRTRQMLAGHYPQTRVYGSSRRMLRDFAPQDVRGLGVDPPPDRSRGYRTAAVTLWAVAVLLTCSLAFVPHDALAATVSRWWPLLVLLAVGWQAGLVWLLARVMAQQTPNAAP